MILAASTSSAPLDADQTIKRWLRNYLYYSTLIYTFSLILASRSGLGLGIRPVEFNLVFLCLLVRPTRIHAWLLAFMLYLTLATWMGIERGTSQLAWAIVEYRAVIISIFYYYLFFRMIRNDSDRAFSTYAKLAFWFAVIALPYWAESCIATHALQRLRGFSTEPAQFCLVVLPAYYWYAYQFRTRRTHLLQVAIFTLTVALSESSLGYLCAAIGVLILFSDRKIYLLTGLATVAAGLSLAYTFSPYVRPRIDQTLIALTGDSDLTDSNLSTYSFISNAIVTEQVLRESPLLGNGLGSHPTSHQRYLQDIPGVEYFTGMSLESMNALEAGSLTFRVLSEFGILGFAGVLFFLVYFHVGGTGPRAAISNGLLLCFLLKLIRSGEYYQPEQFLFIFIYMLNFKKYKVETASQGSPGKRRKPWFTLGLSRLRPALPHPTANPDDAVV